jgi:hypothetical protein
MAIYSVNHTEHINTMCGQNSQFSNVKAVGTVITPVLRKAKGSK